MVPSSVAKVNWADAGHSDAVLRIHDGSCRGKGLEPPSGGGMVKLPSTLSVFSGQRGLPLLLSAIQKRFPGKAMPQA
jgi:hypothetical protein